MVPTFNYRWLVPAMAGFVALLSVASPSIAQEEPAVDKITAETKSPAANPDSPGIAATQPESGPYVKVADGVFMVPYSATIPGTDVSFEMIPIPGGTFLLGSPDDEEDRSADEGPQINVNVDPFWMGKNEVTWREYKQYMGLQEAFKEFQTRGVRVVTEERKVDSITAPSALYDPSFTYDAGDHPDQPAATMTQYAARQYTKWLSITSGQFYRLPGEAEWEYACRAGTTTPWNFGDSADDITKHAWLDDNADYERHKVGKKKPNAFGLHDMHGNVAEWVLDQYSEQGYSHLDATKTWNAIDTINWPTTPDPLVMRGGSFEMTADRVRSAARLASNNREWKQEDPNSPKSPWWFTTEPSTGVGFRLVRPWTVPDAREAKERYWSDVPDKDAYAIKFRIENEGRGARGLVDPELPQAIRDLGVAGTAKDESGDK
jgi:formylglycine-generating enzyme